MLKMLACDLGASNGRVVLGSFNGNTLSMEEIHRFPNYPVFAAGRLYWDVLRLFNEIKIGLFQGLRLHNDIVSVGVDTWGSDFGLLDENGHLLANPYHYRDSYTNGMLKEVLKKVSMEELYYEVGAEMSELSTLFMVYSLHNGKHAHMRYAKTLLLMPDLFNYFLSGIKATEYTIASSTRLVNPVTKKWLYGLMDKLNLSKYIFTDIITPGTVLGDLTREVSGDLGGKSLKVIATSSHDTASAVAAIPAQDEDLIYISSGTWSLVGIETDSPIITKKAMEHSFINEGGVCGKTRFLKNVMGLWFIEQCRSDWKIHGEEISYSDMDMLAEKAGLFEAFINPSDSSFVSPGNMPNKIREFCHNKNQKIPDGKGEIVAVINQSLAMEYRNIIEQIEKISGKKFSKIFIVGGGVKNKALCQYTANATGKEVFSGYSETVSVGNILMQAMAMGEIKNLSELRQVVKASFPVEYYMPKDKEIWDEAYEKYIKVTENFMDMRC